MKLLAVKGELPAMEIPLKAGFHPFRIRFCRVGLGEFKLFWKRTGARTVQPVSLEHLFHKKP